MRHNTNTMDGARLKRMLSLSPSLASFPPYSVARRQRVLQYFRLAFFLLLYTVAGDYNPFYARLATRSLDLTTSSLRLKTRCVR